MKKTISGAVLKTSRRDLQLLSLGRRFFGEISRLRNFLKMTILAVLTHIEISCIILQIKQLLSKVIFLQSKVKKLRMERWVKIGHSICRNFLNFFYPTYTYTIQYPIFIYLLFQKRLTFTCNKKTLCTQKLFSLEENTWSRYTNHIVFTKF